MDMRFWCRLLVAPGSRDGSEGTAGSAFVDDDRRCVVRRAFGEVAVGEDVLRREDRDAAGLERFDFAAVARGLTLLVGMEGEIHLEDSEHEAVEHVAMRRAEHVTALRGMRAPRPGLGVAIAVNEAGAASHAVDVR